MISSKRLITHTHLLVALRYLRSHLITNPHSHTNNLDPQTCEYPLRQRSPSDGTRRTRLIQSPSNPLLYAPFFRPDTNTNVSIRHLKLHDVTAFCCRALGTYKRHGNLASWPFHTDPISMTDLPIQSKSDTFANLFTMLAGPVRCDSTSAAQNKMVVTKQVSSQLEWLSTLSTTFDAMDENEKFLRKVRLRRSP